MNFKQWLWDAYKLIIIVLGIVFVGSIGFFAAGKVSEGIFTSILFVVVGATVYFGVKKHWKKLDEYKDENGNLKI